MLYVYLDGRQDTEVEALREKLRLLIAERAGEREWGRKVYEITIPLKTERLVTTGKRSGHYVADQLAPTLNVYGSMKVWQRSALYKALDLRILAELARWPRCRPAADKRAVRVTRHSSHAPDEITVDVIGGKVPIDRLVRAQILTGDRAEDLEREAQWVPAPPNRGRLVVEVYELEPAGRSPVATP